MPTDFFTPTEAEMEAKQLLKVASTFWNRVLAAQQRGYLSKKATLFLNDAGAELGKQIRYCQKEWNRE